MRTNGQRRKKTKAMERLRAWKQAEEAKASQDAWEKVHKARTKAYAAFHALGCEICGEWKDHEVVPFQQCNLCWSRRSFHHVHCCPDKFSHLQPEEEEQPIPTSEKSKPERRIQAYFALHALGCEHCGEWLKHEVVPLPWCKFCYSTPSFHHEHCCQSWGRL